MWMGRLTPQLLRLIEAEQPDIITAQEVFSTDTSVPFPDQMFDLRQRVSSLDYPHVYYSPVFSFQASGQTVEFGNAVFSRLPIQSSETVWTYSEYQGAMDRPGFEKNARNAQVVELRSDAKAFYLINHHGYWEPNPTGSDTSVAALQVVADKVASLDGPIIVAGDLNVDDQSPAMRVFDDHLTSLTARYDIQDTLSILGKVRGIACDHVLTNSDIHVRSFSVSDALVSDHLALVLEFDL